MALSRTQLKALFEQGDRLKASSFIDLIDSLVSTKEDSTVSGSILPEVHEAFNLGSAQKAWKEIFVSTGSLNFVDNDGTITSFSKEDLNKAKDIAVQRQSDEGIPLKRLRAFNSASSFINFNTTSSGVTAGSAIDFIINNNLEAIHLSETRMSLGPSNNFPVEITGALDVKANSSKPHKFGGKIKFTGEVEGSGNSGFELTGSLFQSSSGGQVTFGNTGSSFTGGNVVIEDAIMVQAGVISQSINIGTSTSPSVAEYIGVHDNHRITLAPGVKVNVFPGSRLIIKPQQPNLSADTSTGDIVVSSVGGGGIAFNIGEFGTNPQFIPMHMSIPAGNQAIWYGPIFIGRFSNQIGQILNLDAAGQGQNASLRIHEGANIRINAF